ncbi:MAG: sulfatase [Thermoanaerobaculia bacterium]|nr:sulfatase [Thermoanaerobaculia bacterium]
MIRPGIFTALTALVLGGCSPTHPSVVLISVDTLRADHLGAYGYGPPTSPRFDALAREGVLFETAVAAAPSTLPSHASIFTSLSPHRHGASFAARRPLADSVLTLAEVLKASGYRTGAFHDGGQIVPELGLGQGFEVYRTIGQDRLSPVAAAGLAWLDGLQRQEPFFLFLHTYETHLPYTPAAADLRVFQPDGYTGFLGTGVGHKEMRTVNNQGISLSPADQRHVVASYDAEIRAMDRALGELLDALRARGRLANTLVVVTSDHGEELGEHGSWAWHSHTLYEELLRVPLVVRLPAGTAERAEGVRLSELARGIDLAPTVLDVVGVPIPSSFEGRSLLPVIRREPSAAPFALSLLDGGDPEQDFAVRRERWKLYGERLFDLEDDRGETVDRSAEHAEITEVLRRYWTRERARGATATGSAIEIEGELRRRLEALGYL